MAGGIGMIGQVFCKLLTAAGANVTVASLDSGERAPEGANFRKIYLRSFENCQEVASDYQTVFHLASIKGSPKMTAECQQVFSSQLCNSA